MAIIKKLGSENNEKLVEKKDGFNVVEKIETDSEAGLETEKLLEEAFEKKELRQRIEAEELPINLQEKVKVEAKNLKSLEDEGKLQRLIAIVKDAKDKKNGIVYAVKVAQGINNPYLLDVLHDELVEKGYYKYF